MVLVRLGDLAFRGTWDTTLLSVTLSGGRPHVPYLNNAGTCGSGICSEEVGPEIRQETGKLVDVNDVDPGE
jgi:hypothetical protein